MFRILHCIEATWKSVTGTPQLRLGVTWSYIGMNPLAEIQKVKGGRKIQSKQHPDFRKLQFLLFQFPLHLARTQKLFLNCLDYSKKNLFFFLFWLMIIRKKGINQSICEFAYMLSPHKCLQSMLIELL